MLAAAFHLAPDSPTSIVTAGAAVWAAIYSFMNRKTAKRIEVNVNHRLDLALQKVESLEGAQRLAASNTLEQVHHLEQELRAARLAPALPGDRAGDVPPDTGMPA